MASKIVKTEHAGAKNGGGYWGDRKEAKTICDKQRRTNAKAIIREAIIAGAKDFPKTKTLLLLFAILTLTGCVTGTGSGAVGAQGNEHGAAGGAWWTVPTR